MVPKSNSQEKNADEIRTTTPKTLTTMTEAYLVTDNVHIQYVYVYRYI